MESHGLTFQLIGEMTDGFSEEREVGSGAFGEVYKGVSRNGIEVAVKKFRNNLNLALNDKQFQTEIDNLKTLRHKNIIQIIGCCYETRKVPTEHNGKIILAEETDRAICLEYMHNGSLRKHLSDDHHQLDWQTRFKIIKGVCKGLKYIHDELDKPIYHLDLKPDNILLTKGMVPKLADFGLSRIFSEETHYTTTTTLKGTQPYMPPEYIERGEISKKFDIFSLGVVMIQIVSGPEGYSEYNNMDSDEFVDQVHGKWRGILEETWSDSSLDMYYEQVKRCTKIALNCVEKNRHKRPSIKEIIYKLKVPLPSLCPCNCPKENETLLHMTLHQLPERWPNVPNPNEITIGQGLVGFFGQTKVDNWIITMGTDPNQKIVGHARGFHMQAGNWYISHIYELQDDWFAGSTLLVFGIHASDSGQWSIVGGTGVFTNAHGTIKFSRVVGGNEVIWALDVHVFYMQETA